MLKFKDYLTELFDKPVPFILVAKKSGDYFKYAFKVNGIEYRAEITRDKDVGHHSYQISFKARNNNGDNSYAFEDEFKGNANQVMSTVVAICKKVFTEEMNIEYDVDEITYVASQNSRQKLYNAIIKKFLNSYDIQYEFKMGFAVGRYMLNGY